MLNVYFSLIWWIFFMFLIKFSLCGMLTYFACVWYLCLIWQIYILILMRDSDKMLHNVIMCNITVKKSNMFWFITVGFFCFLFFFLSHCFLSDIFFILFYICLAFLPCFAVYYIWTHSMLIYVSCMCIFIIFVYINYLCVALFYLFYIYLAFLLCVSVDSTNTLHVFIYEFLY
jgi:hypothetical protein